MNPFRPWSKLVIGLSVGAAVLVLVLGGFAYAAYDASREYEGRILPGVTVAGVDLGGMTETQAVAAVRQVLRPRLFSPLTAEFEDRSWSTSARQMGVRSDLRTAVADAVAASERASFLDRVKIGMFGERLSFEREVKLRYPRRRAGDFVSDIAGEIDKPARDAALDGSSGWVEIVEERVGRKVDVRASRSAVLEALRSGTERVELDVDPVKPEVTADSFDKVLLLRIGENKLYLYDDGEIVEKWTVATGQPEYPTPTGVFEITLKRYLPTWVNPDPDGWGAGMPATIPPGPGNPLGLRALNWSAPLIRFHGTSATYSLGYNASHGCVRLSNEDVTELYDLVDVGTPIVSVVAGPLKPLTSSSPDPIVVNEEEKEPVAEQDSDASGDGSSADGDSDGGGKKKG